MFGVPGLYFAMYIAPPLVLLILFLKKKRFIWLTVPICLVIDIICMWQILTYYESWGIAVYVIIIQMAVISAALGIVAAVGHFRRKRLKKLSAEQTASFRVKEKKVIRIVGIAAGVIAVAVIAYNIFINTSVNYNDYLDRKAFSSLIEITAEDIETVELIFPRDLLEESPMDIYYHGDKTFIGEIVYGGSGWKKYNLINDGGYCARVILKSSDPDILFNTAGNEIFLVYYKSRWFYVTSPQLWNEIKR